MKNAGNLTKRSRRGIASLELVMGLPFLLLIVASSYSIAKAALGKQEALIEVRQDAWTQARKPDPNRRSDELVSQRWLEGRQRSAMTSLSPRSDILVCETEETVTIAHWLGGSVDPHGKTALVVGTWDHQTVRMDRTGPHLFLLPKLVRQGASGIASAGQLAGQFFDGLRNGIRNVVGL